MFSATTFNFNLNDRHQIRIFPCFVFGHIAKTNDIPMMAMSWAAVDFFAADVGKDSIGIPGIFGDQLVHSLDRRGILIRIIKCEPHSKNITTYETLPSIGQKRSGIFVAAFCK